MFLSNQTYSTREKLNEKQKKYMKEIRQEVLKMYGISKVLAWKRLKNIKLCPGEPLDGDEDEIQTVENHCRLLYNVQSREVIAARIIDNPI